MPDQALVQAGLDIVAPEWGTTLGCTKGSEQPVGPIVLVCPCRLQARNGLLCAVTPNMLLKTVTLKITVVTVTFALTGRVPGLGDDVCSSSNASGSQTCATSSKGSGAQGLRDSGAQGFRGLRV